MNTEKTNQKYQKAVFGGEILKIIPELDKFQNIIDTFFDEQILFATNGDLGETKEQILQVEKELSGVVTVDFLKNLIPETLGDKPTPFLSDEKIVNLLQTHPPVIINAVIDNNKDLQKMPPRTILSLTRFTEDSDWQKHYLTLLAGLQDSDFSLRSPVVDKVNISDFLGTLHTQTSKPWQVTHSKETGTIVLLDSDKSACATPNLLRLSVFLHYLFEVHYFSRQIQTASDEGLKDIINNILGPREIHFPFLTDNNAHDETLYWKRAIEKLCQITEIDSDSVNSYRCRILNEGDSITSLNIIDIIWDINNIQGISNPIYHLQQDIWSTLQEKLNVSGIDFEVLVKDSLHLDNKSFLENILSYP
jgi:hypothetical protein